LWIDYVETNDGVGGATKTEEQRFYLLDSKPCSMHGLLQRMGEEMLLLVRAGVPFNSVELLGCEVVVGYDINYLRFR
jgi:hypothetical protein